MSALTVPTVQNSHILAAVYLQFTTSSKLESLAIPNLDFSKKIKKVLIMEDKF